MADALYLQFLDGATRTESSVFVDLRYYIPAPGEILLPWSPVDGDMCASNYRREGNSLVYEVPSPSAPPPKPDPDAMLTAIWDDPVWQSAPEARPIRPQLAAMKDLLKVYLERGEIQRVYEAWEDIKIGLPAPIAALVEGYAAAFNVPLVPPQ